MVECKHSWGREYFMGLDVPRHPVFRINSQEGKTLVFSFQMHLLVLSMNQNVNDLCLYLSKMGHCVHRPVVDCQGINRKPQVPCFHRGPFPLVL